MAELKTSYQVSLADGAELLLRPVRPEDRNRIREGVNWFSADALYQRFFTPIAKLSEAQLDFLSQPDQVDHLAWGALDEAHPEIPGVAVARCVRLPDDPAVAEASLIVLDDYQGRGIGTLMLALLNLNAAVAGIGTLRALTLVENRGFLRLMSALGGRPVHESGNILRVDLPVRDDPVEVPASAAHYRAALEALLAA